MKKVFTTFGLTALVMVLTSFTTPETKITTIVENNNTTEIVSGNIFSTRKLDATNGNIFSTRKLDATNGNIFSTRKLDGTNGNIFSTRKLD